MTQQSPLERRPWTHSPLQVLGDGKVAYPSNRQASAVTEAYNAIKRMINSAKEQHQ